MFIICIDFDGTLFSKSWPEKGEPIKEVIEKAKEFQKTGMAECVLWTCREGKSLQEAIDRCSEYGLRFDAINDNAPSEIAYKQKRLKENNDVFANRKVYADIYVDDKSPGSIEYFLKIKVKETCNNFKDRE